MKLTFRDKTFEVKSGTTARDAIKKVGLDPESVLIVVNGKLCTDDVLLKDEDQVKLVAVVSGGESAGHVPFAVNGFYLNRARNSE